MPRITPRTCLWPLVGCVSATFALSIGLTYRSNHHCYAGTCGEWLFPLQARLHVVVWYLWISISISFLALRAFQPWIRVVISRPLGTVRTIFGKQLRVSGILMVFWILVLYGILVGIWWLRLRDYFHDRGAGLPGNNIVAAVAQTGHLADVTTGMVLLPVARHSALASFFKLSPSTTYVFHMTMAYVLFGLIITHASLYAAWAAFYDQSRDRFRHIFPVLNPTYLYNEVWPGDTSGLGIWRASLIFTGIVAGLIMTAMFFTSFPVVRRKHFNVFYFTHLLGIVAIVVICLHASTMFYCTIPGLSMWLLDWGMRIFELNEKLDSRLTSLGNGWYSISLPLPRKRLAGCACHSPLAHFYIHHSQSSIREIHPFTTITHLASKKPLLRSEDHSIPVQFLFKASVSTATPLKKATQWTNRLGSLVDEDVGSARTDDKEASAGTNVLGWPDVEARRADTELRLEGPYFTPANPEQFRTVICFGAGTGLSGCLAIAAAFNARHASKNSGIWQRCIVIWSVRERDYVDMPFFDELKCDGLEFRVHKTGGSQPRLDMRAALAEICQDDGTDCWCYISGPNGYISAAERACGEVKGLTWFAARWE